MYYKKISVDEISAHTNCSSMKCFTNKMYLNQMCYLQMLLEPNINLNNYFRTYPSYKFLKNVFFNYSQRSPKNDFKLNGSRMKCLANKVWTKLKHNIVTYNYTNIAHVHYPTLDAVSLEKG